MRVHLNIDNLFFYDIKHFKNIARIVKYIYRRRSFINILNFDFFNNIELRNITFFLFLKNIKKYRYSSRFKIIKIV